MSDPKQPPVPPKDVTSEPLKVTDSQGEGPIRVADLRAHFERMARQVPRDPAAERAFIESKIELIRTDPHLSDAAKQQAIEDLRRRL
jgi:hypothetical protein